MRITDFPPKAINFLLRGYGLPEELGLPGLQIPYMGFIESTGKAPSQERVIGGAVAKTFIDDDTGLANFVAVGLCCPEEEMVRIFMETDNIDERNEQILGAAYSHFCSLRGVSEESREAMDEFLTVVFVNYFMPREADVRSH